MKSRFLLSLGLAFALPACATTSQSPPQTAASAPASAKLGVVSAADPRAAAAGIQILNEGGNATDAAIATMLALNVVETQNSGIGGGLFWVRHDGRTGALTTIDGRETAPAAATDQWFLGQDGKPLPPGERYVGGLAVGVPGAVAAMAEAHEKYGRLPWAKLFEPAIKLARDGFTVSPRMHNGLALYARHLTGWAKQTYFDASGNAAPIGSTLKIPALADTFEKLAREGGEAFYREPNAGAIAQAVQGTELNPAPLTESDVTSYKAIERAPVCGTYRQYRICGMGPPSSGGITVLMILKQLERFDLAALGPKSPVAWHLLAESERLAYADRNAYIGDPKFVSVPVKGMLADDYIASRSALIDPATTLGTYEPGKPAGAPDKVRAVFTPDPGTSDLAVTDADGNVVQVTTTVNGYFGSGIAVGGYMLNNELPDFDAAPEKDGYLTANRVEGGKRPRSSMAPTIVYDPDGKVRVAIGAAGGATIICQVAKALIGIIDWHMSAQDAIAMGLVYAPGAGGAVEQGTELEGLLPGLQALGETLQVRPLGLKANAIEWIDGKPVGAADPRSEGVGMDTAGNVTQIVRRTNQLNGAHE